MRLIEQLQACLENRRNLANNYACITTENERLRAALEVTLDALRTTRDKSAPQWDALMGTTSGPVICTAWDTIRAALAEGK